MRKTIQFSTLVLKDTASLVSLNNKCTCVCSSNLFLQKNNLMGQQSSSVNVEHQMNRNLPLLYTNMYIQKKRFKISACILNSHTSRTDEKLHELKLFFLVYEIFCFPFPVY